MKEEISINKSLNLIVILIKDNGICKIGEKVMFITIKYINTNHKLMSSVYVIII
jgi:hypothetical protein